MATPPTPTSGALTVNSTTGVILSPVTAALFRSANGIGTGTGDVTASGTLTANALILGGGTTVVSASALTYSGTTLSVPDAFVVSSAGSIGLTAGGAAKDITLTASSGGVVKTASELFAGPFTAAQGTTATFNGTTSEGGFIWLLRDNGVSNLSNGDIVGSFEFSGRFNSSTNDVAKVRGIYTGDGTTRSGELRLMTRKSGSLISSLVISDYGKLTQNLGATSIGAWGVTGSVFSSGTVTITDSSSSGTVATAVARSFAVPTFSAPVPVTYTNSANLYIAGDVAFAGSASGTNSYGLWNVGKTRLDSGIYLGGTTPGVIDGSSGAITLTGAGTNQNITLTPSGTGETHLVSTGTSASLVFDNSAGTFRGYLHATSSTMRLAGVAGALHLLSSNALSLAISGGASATLTGGAGNMTLTAGTGASRTMTFQTTTAGSTATNWLVGDASQNTTAGGSITTSTPNGGTAGAWKFGIRVAAVSALDTTQYIQLDVGGTLYKLALIA